jgi:hypothetical protein
VEHVDFSRLDEENFVSFISVDEFYADEIDIFKSCIRFGEIGDRDISKLLKFVRFPLITSIDLASTDGSLDIFYHIDQMRRCNAILECL